MSTREKCNVLLLATRRRVFFLQKLRAVLAEVMPRASVLYADIDRQDPVSHLADESVVIPARDSTQYEEALRDLIERRDIGLVVPWNDLDIDKLCEIRSRLEAAGASLFLPPTPIVRLFNDKLQTHEWARQHGIVQPRLLALRHVTRFPVILKHRASSGGQGVFRLDSEVELAAKVDLAADGRHILQEFVEGDEYTVDVGTNEGSPHFIVPRRRLKTRGGEVVIARVEMRAEVIEFVSRVLAALGTTGIFNVQLILNQRGCHLLEFNPRIGGGTDLTIEAGADIARYMLELWTDGRILSPGPVCEDGLLMTRYLAPIFARIPAESA